MTSTQATQDAQKQTTFWLTHNSGYVEEGVEICLISTERVLDCRFVTDETQKKLREASTYPDTDGQWAARVDEITRTEKITCSVRPYDEPARTMLREHNRFSVVKRERGDIEGLIELRPIR